jgi:hypothetical protein
MDFAAAFPSLKAWRRHNRQYSQRCLEDSANAIVRYAIQRAIRGAEYEEPPLMCYCNDCNSTRRYCKKRRILK